MRPRLRILCLHGFRQSASGLKGRLASFTKKLKGVADFVFVDAPHKVPLIFSKGHTLEEATRGRTAVHLTPESKVTHRKYTWLVTPEMASTFPDSQAPGDLISDTIPASRRPVELTPESKGLHRKYAWFVTPEMASTLADSQAPGDLISDTNPDSKTSVEFDRDQYKKQTLGWPTSLSMLEKVFSDLGPFDGVLGFSQGAAVAASLCLLSESAPQANKSIQFRFVILCSGFVSSASEVQELLSRSTLPLNCPSLHIFAESTGHDSQIVNEDSKQLASMFSSKNSVVLTHNMGHIVPSRRETVDKVKSFLNQFL